MNKLKHFGCYENIEEAKKEMNRLESFFKVKFNIRSKRSISVKEKRSFLLHYIYRANRIPDLCGAKTRNGKECPFYAIKDGLCKIHGRMRKNENL